MLLAIALLAVYVRFDVARGLTGVTSFLLAAGFALHTAAVWEYAATANRQLLEVRKAAIALPPGRRMFQLETNQNLRFLADPLLHSDGYVTLWSRGILLSNYEAAHYYFPVQLRPPYPQTLASFVSQLQSLDPTGREDRALVQKFLADDGPFLDVLLVRTADEGGRRLYNRPLAKFFGRVIIFGC